MRLLQHLSFEFIDPQTDFALLKVDFEANAAKDWLKGKTAFPFIEISTRELSEGEPVYSFGYPLPEARTSVAPEMKISVSELCPRVTSAIVSSTFERSKPVMSPQDPLYYVLDKALNYGNSGGPIVAVETGKVHALCSRFQHVIIPQHHLQDDKGRPMPVKIPSLYGVVSGLSNPAIVQKLREKNVPTSSD